MSVFLLWILASLSTGPLLWMQDDYAAAVAQAKASGKPLVIDLWAPWCHTCLSMQQTVLADPSMAEVADAFVWVSIDTDKAVNAKVLRTLKIEAWPTFYVLDPKNESVLSRHVGGATMAEFRAFLDQGRSEKLAPAEAASRAGDIAAASGKFKAAITAYDAALALAPKGWARIPPLLVSRIALSRRIGDYSGCAGFGLKNMEAAGGNRSAALADFTWYAHDCAQQSKSGELTTLIRSKALGSKSVLRSLLPKAEKNWVVDDYSETLHILRDLEDSAGHKAKAKKLARIQLNLLKKAADKAPSAKARMLYNWPRAEVHVYLGEAASLVPDLRANAAALPNEYDPAYRLAWILFKLKKYPEALVPAQQALAKVYGPRAARVQGLIAAIHAARKDRPAEKIARQKVVEIYQALPAGQQQPAALKKAQAVLKAL